MKIKNTVIHFVGLSVCSTMVLLLFGHSLFSSIAWTTVTILGTLVLFFCLGFIAKLVSKIFWYTFSFIISRFTYIMMEAILFWLDNYDIRMINNVIHRLANGYDGEDVDKFREQLMKWAK